MYIVTGGAGFIGSHIVKAFNTQGITDILVVDDLTDGSKFINLVDLNITDYMDKNEFITQIVSGQEFGSIDAVFHLGANTSLTETDGKLMMENNYEYSKDLLHYCIERDICFIYASDSAVYGDSNETTEVRANEKPTSLYAFTKFMFDQYVRNIEQDALAHNEQLSQIIGLRYGVVKETETETSIGIKTVCELNLWLLEQQQISGIYNFGVEAHLDLTNLNQIGFSIN